MNSKQTLTIVAIAMVAFGMIAATTIVGPDDASAKKKSCEAKKWSHCKGDHHWYTKKGHHHCYKWEKGCKYFEY
jgi:hypothetical protein